MKLRSRKRRWTGLFIALLAAPSLASGQAQEPATAGEAKSPTAQESSVTVTGQRMPMAEAPRWATCVLLSRDPYYRALRGAGMTLNYLPTRAPRNPDYDAPPLVPPGSPLPVLPERRFAMPNMPDSLPIASTGAGLAGGSAFAQTGDSYSVQTSREQAVANCAGTSEPVPVRLDRADSSFFTDQVTAPTAHFAQRLQIVLRDETLPMAFALFDQGRYTEALTWFRKAARRLRDQQGGDEAKLFVGKILLQGLGERSDPEAALRWLKRAALAKYSSTTDLPVFDPLRPERNTASGEAAVILGNIYLNGFGPVEPDPSKARRWFKRAWDVGHVPAAKIMGDLHARGIGTAPDQAKAARWYQRAARYGVAPAQFALAELLLQGAGRVRADPKKALSWYAAAAEAGHPAALQLVAAVREADAAGR